MKADLRRSIKAAAFQAGVNKKQAAITTLVPRGVDARYFTREQWQSILDMDAQLRETMKALRLIAGYDGSGLESRRIAERAIARVQAIARAVQQ